jgi:hypothetical protein
MPESIQRNRGRPSNYKLDRGGVPAESGPFIAEVRNNNDPTRSGRLQVFIEEFGGDDKNDTTQWRTVSYLSPFYGITQKSGSNDGLGDYVGNRHSYGMWFTPPDIGTKVLCFFANGDPNRGYYVGCIPEPGLTHMVPAIGASENLKKNNQAQNNFLKNATRLPVTEINNENKEISEDPRFFDNDKPVHSYVAGVMFQQGLSDDRVRGPIGSTSQRESPSAVYGISTPGRAIYQGGLSEKDITNRLASGSVRPDQVKVIGRRGGHSFVMDDGDIDGNDQLVRIRSSKGHQILFSDDGDCIHVIHANGQSWVELGKEGTVDVFSTNSINMRTQGNINFHADKSINLYGKESVNIVSKKLIQIESDENTNIITQDQTKIHSKGSIGVLSNASFSLKAEGNITQSSSGNTSLTASRIDLNGGAQASVSPPNRLKKTKLPDVEWDATSGWKVVQDKIESIADRIPTHEPYPVHNQGVDAPVSLATASAPPPRPSPALQSNLDSAASRRAQNPIDVDEFVNQPKATQEIGPLNTDQVTAIMAQRAKDVGQSFSEISLANGIGKFGFTADQLENLGYLKPGVTDLLSADDDLSELLQNPEFWSGDDGISSISDLLDSELIQDKIEQSLLNEQFNELSARGIIDQLPDQETIAGFLQSSAQFGVGTVSDWAQGKLGETSDIAGQLTSQIENSIKQAQYAITFVKEKLPETLSVAKETVGFTKLVKRDALDSSVSEILGNDKIPNIQY